MRYKSVVIIILITLSIILISLGIRIDYTEKQTKKIEKLAVNTCNKLYNEKKEPREDLTFDSIVLCKNQIKKVKNKIKKEKLTKETNQVEKYYILKNELYNYIENGIIKKGISQEQIKVTETKIKELPKKYQNLLKENIDQINEQLSILSLFEMEISKLYVDSNKQQVISSVTKEQYNGVLGILGQIKNEEIRSDLSKYVDQVDKYIKEREKEELRKKIEAEKKRKEEINKAWIKLNVPYISQNNAGVLNGCEAASLLMALKYKGYLSDMDLPTYATNMPKSDNPNTGFYLDIFGIEPTGVSHWIAPSPLANFGRESSGNQNIIDATGMNIEQIDNEIINNNPVVIYLTAKFKTPKNWSNGVPSNLHVLLLTGYNTITGQHIITDPWTKDDGGYEWILEKKEIENLYNSLGKRAVIVR